MESERQDHCLDMILTIAGSLFHASLLPVYRLRLPPRVCEAAIIVLTAARLACRVAGIVQSASCPDVTCEVAKPPQQRTLFHHDVTAGDRCSSSRASEHLLLLPPEPVRRLPSRLCFSPTQKTA